MSDQIEDLQIKRTDKKFIFKLLNVISLFDGYFLNVLLSQCCVLEHNYSTPRMFDFLFATRPTHMDLKSKSSSDRQSELLNSFDITCNDLSRPAIDSVVTSCTVAISSRESDHAAMIH